MIHATIFLEVVHMTTKLSQLQVQVQVLSLNGLLQGAWEAARLLADGEQKEGAKKINRLRKKVSGLPKPGTPNSLEAYGVDTNPATYEALLKKIEEDPHTMLKQLPDLVSQKTAQHRILLNAS